MLPAPGAPIKGRKIGYLETKTHFINPFTLCTKLLRPEPNFYALNKLLKSWAQSVNGFMKSIQKGDFESYKGALEQ